MSTKIHFVRLISLVDVSDQHWKDFIRALKQRRNITIDGGIRHDDLINVFNRRMLNIKGFYYKV